MIRTGLTSLLSYFSLKIVTSDLKLLIYSNSLGSLLWGVLSFAVEQTFYSTLELACFYFKNGVSASSWEFVLDCVFKLFGFVRNVYYDSSVLGLFTLQMVAVFLDLTVGVFILFGKGSVLV